MNRRNFVFRSLASSALCAARGRTPIAIAETFQTGPLPGVLPPSLQERLMQDPLRPQFHLLPMANWMNDPCAPRFHRGQYHMFFQYNPGAAVWGDMHWAHAVSPDLIHWKHLPIALAPTPGSSDAYGIFTGSVLPEAADATVIYTGVTRCSPEEETIRDEGIREVQCLAISTDPDLRTWKKLDAPILAAPPPGLKVTGFRDPCPWKEGNLWYMIVGSGFTKVGGAVLLYRSSNGHHWDYLHPLAQGVWNGGAMTNPVDTGEMWECPDFFPLQNKHVLLYSTERKVYWEVGTFNKQELRFHRETRGILDHGYYYAMKSMPDAHGRRILWGWVQETRGPELCRAAGWAGSMALPRLLTLGADNRLCMEVPPEFASLRQDTKDISSSVDLQTLNIQLAKVTIQNRAAEVVLNLKTVANPSSLEFRTGTSPLLTVNFSGGDKPSLIVGEKTLPLVPGSDGASTVRLWIDGSIIEIFADDKEALTIRNYTPSPGGIQLTWTGAAEALSGLAVHEIKPISDDRLTS